MPVAEHEAIARWLALRLLKRRSYIRPAHYTAARNRTSFAIFWRYYNSPDERDLVRFLRITKPKFDQLYTKLQDQLDAHCPTHLRPINGIIRLAIFLRFIATGPTYSAVAILFAIGDSTVVSICREVASAIVISMESKYLPTPSREMWIRNSELYGRLRNFKNAIGSIDGKHIAISRPDNSGSIFYNYKKFYSIVLLAIADAESRFIAVDIGAAGRNSDATLWISSPIRAFMESPAANLPPVGVDGLPYVILGDGGFGCTDLIITPFTEVSANTNERIVFNERLSRARSSVEHAFGIFAQRWRLFLGVIEASPSNVRLFAHAAVILHNYLTCALEGEVDDDIFFPENRRLLADQRNKMIQDDIRR
uniref:DDE Tnp4 domain-containing protein n=1 Tax=Ditylenchus dipsaci TaxID=166011 RepID=A0A915E7H4_9BILA